MYAVTLKTLPLIASHASFLVLCFLNSSLLIGLTTPLVPAISQPELHSRTQSISECPGSSAHLLRGLPASKIIHIFLLKHMCFCFHSFLPVADPVVILVSVCVFSSCCDLDSFGKLVATGDSCRNGVVGCDLEDGGSNNCAGAAAAGFGDFSTGVKSF